MLTQKKRSLRQGNCTTSPRVTQLVPKRKILCFLLLKTASRKIPPKATLAPRLWQRVSSVTSHRVVPGTRVASRQTRRMRHNSSQFQRAWLNRRKAAEWSWEPACPVVSQRRLMVRRPRQTTQAVAISLKVTKTSARKQGAKGASRELKLEVS